MTGSNISAKPSIAFILPALNEEANLARAVEACASSARRRELPYRCYVFDDGSRDRTATIADALAQADAGVVVTHNARTMGLGYNYFRGIDLAVEDYAIMVPGDAEIGASAIGAVLDRAGQADLVIPFVTGQEARPLGRRIVSRAFVGLMNRLFGLSIAYYNGPCLIRRALVKDVPLRSDGFAYMAAILVILLKRGHSYVELPIPLEYRRHGRSKAFAWRNVTSVLRTLGRLISYSYK